MTTAQATNNYPNPLDAFRSYSYQFILTVANTTTALESMVGSATSTDPSPLLSQVSQVNGLGLPFTLSNGDTAYLLCDTRRFSQYQINGVSTEHIYGTGTTDNPSAIFTSVKINVVDSTGLSFFNMLMDTFKNKLQTTRATSFFLLTILFVGHDTTGMTQTISTCNIPLMLIDLGFELTGIGGTFDMNFMEMEGAPSKGGGAEFSNSLGSVTYISSKDTDQTLGGVVSALENQLNIQMLSSYQKFFNTATASTTTPSSTTAPPAVSNTSTSTPASTSNQQMNKLVQYMITIPDDWKNFKCDLSDRSKNTEQMFKAKKQSTPASTTPAKSPVTIAGVDQQQAYATVSFSTTTTVTEAVEKILKLSQDILNLASEDKRKAGTALTFKTIMNITSDTSLYLIHIDVFPYNLPKTTTPPSSDSTASTTSTVDAGTSNGNVSTSGDASTIQNLITYNYIFTGENQDILDLKIKYNPESAIALDTNVNLGQARLASNAAQGQTSQGAQAAAKDGEKSSPSFSPELRPADPIFYPSKSRDQLNNVASHKTEQLSNDQSTAAFNSKQQFTQTWANIHFISSIGINVPVRGNPNIIRKYADRAQRGGVPPHTATISTTDLNTIRTGSNTAAQNFTSILQPLETTAKQQYYTQYVKPRIDGFSKTVSSGDQLLNGADVSVAPVLCKLNIKAPNVDVSGQVAPNADGTAGPLYTDQYFYNGTYMVMGVKTDFQGGNFTHELTLNPYSIDNTSTQNDQTPAPITKQA